jgi:acetyl-CoA carboxylase biotin carboxyl carrier protein
MATEVRAELTANVWKIQIAVGAEVGEGDEIIILESMKMEIPVEAPAAGKIATLHTEEGASVEEGDLLATIE